MGEPDLRRALGAWITDHVSNGAPVEVSWIRRASTGASADTFLCGTSSEAGERQVVVRRQSATGSIFPDSDIELQAGFMRTLRRKGIPAPRLLGSESDPGVIGAPFLIMDWVAGHALSHSNFEGWLQSLSIPERGRVWRNCIEAISAINRLDWREGFDRLDRKQHGVTPGLDQYLASLIAWRDDVVGDRQYDVLAAGVDYLTRERPTGIAPGVLWGDSNPGNFLFADDQSVSAVLDFEAAAIGPPEADLGWWLMMDARRCRDRGRLPGLPDVPEMIAIYEEALGRKAEAMHYFQILAYVRMTLVVIRSISLRRALGLLSSTCEAGVKNPYTAMLATALDIPPPEVGTDFLEFLKSAPR